MTSIINQSALFQHSYDIESRLNCLDVLSNETISGLIFDLPEKGKKRFLSFKKAKANGSLKAK